MTKRIVGLDLARGISLFGMVLNHEVFRIDIDYVLQLDTIGKWIFILIGGPIALLSGFRGFFLMISTTTFTYLNSPSILIHGGKQLGTLILRYIVSFPILILFQSLKEFTIYYSDMKWKYVTHSGPINYLAVIFLIISPLLLLIKLTLVPINHILRKRRTATTVDTSEINNKEKDEIEPNLSIIHLLRTISIVSMVLGILLPLPTRAIQRWTIKALDTKDMKSIERLAVDFPSACKILMFQLLAGDNTGLFPFLGPSLIGAGVGLRLRADQLQKVSRHTGVKREVHLSLIVGACSLVITAYEMLFTDWKPDIQDDFRMPGPGLTVFQASLQQLLLTYVLVKGEPLSSSGKQKAYPPWVKSVSVWLRQWSTYSLTIYVLNYLPTNIIRPWMSSWYPDTCNFVKSHQCYVLWMVILEMIVVGIAWSLFLYVWGQLLCGVLTLDWVMSAVGRVTTGRRPLLPKLEDIHRDTQPVRLWLGEEETKDEELVMDVVREHPLSSNSSSEVSVDVELEAGSAHVSNL